MIDVLVVGKGRFGNILGEKFGKLSLTSEAVSSLEIFRDKLPDCRIVCVATPTPYHYIYVREAILASKDVFCEKPFCMRGEDAKELVSLANEYGVDLFIDNVFLLHNEYISQKENLQNSSGPIEFSWNKPEGNLENIFHSLVYHDLCMIYDICGGVKFSDLEAAEVTQDRLSFSFRKASRIFHFLYNRKSSKTEKKIVYSELESTKEIVFSSTSQDPLGKMVADFCSGDADFETNQKMHIFVTQETEVLSNALSPSVAVVGGGIFGCCAATCLSKSGLKVDLYEKQQSICQGATGANQFRVHRGYHYPRSSETIEACLNAEKAFLSVFSKSILQNGTRNYYAIPKSDSLTSPDIYREILNKFSLDFEESICNVLKEEEFAFCAEVQESLIDPYKLKIQLEDLLKNNEVRVNIGRNADQALLAQYKYVINATYANLNSLYDLDDTKMLLKFEICEKPIFRLPRMYRNISVVVIDGPFMCIDPLGRTRLHLMGNVEHAIHATNTGYYPIIPDELKDYIHQGVIEKPRLSKSSEFISAANKYFKGLGDAEYVGSMFVIRAVLPNREHDDGRPTIISEISEDYFQIFSGKMINAVDAGNEIATRISRAADIGQYLISRDT